jgi:hypothetical protein
MSSAPWIAPGPAATGVRVGTSESVNARTGGHRAPSSASGRRMLTSAGITLIAVGAVLLNVHVAGVVMMLAGVCGLLLSPLAGAVRLPRCRVTGLHHASGNPDLAAGRSRPAKRRRAAAYVAALREDDRYCGPDKLAPGDAIL